MAPIAPSTSRPTLGGLSAATAAPGAPATTSPRPAIAADRVEIGLTRSATLAFGMKDADYGQADPGPGRRGPIRELQLDLQKLGHFKSRHGATGGYFDATRAAVIRLQAAHSLPGTGRMDPATAQALAADLAQLAAGKPPARPPAPAKAQPAPVKTQPAAERPAAETHVAGADGPLTGLGLTKRGLTIPNGGRGKATTFWNGHYLYKGKRDKHNMCIGAWGDQNKPTDYFVALPISKRAWHNQKILLTNPTTGQQVVALVQDKGPAGWTGAKIDLSPVTMEALGGHFEGSHFGLRYEFAPADAPVGPVRRR